MNEYPNVAIDGPVASGKTTAARGVASRLGTLYLDTGAMYRAVAYAALRAGLHPDDEPGVLALLAATPVLVEPDSAAPLGFRITCGGLELGAELFDRRIEAVVSIVAALPGVRRELVRIQRAIAERGPVVMAGRDIGTVVLPEAPVKVFLTASVEARVTRRLAELTAAGRTVDEGALRAEIEARDAIDASRSIAPLRPAAGATVLDSSFLHAGEVVDRIVALARDAVRP